MYTTFVFQSGIRTFSVNHKSNFFKSADSIFVETHHLRLPILGFCVFHIHSVNFCCKQSRFVSACTCTNFHNNVLLIIRVFWQKKNFQFLFQFLNPLLGIWQFFFQHFPHVFVRFLIQKHQTVFHSLLAAFIFIICVCNRLQFTLLLHQLLKSGCVIGHSGLVQFI